MWFPSGKWSILISLLWTRQRGVEFRHIRQNENSTEIKERRHTHIQLESKKEYFFCFFRNLKDPSGKNLFMCCCTDLALESRDYDLLFGVMDDMTGLRSSGLLDQFNNPHIDSKVRMIFLYINIFFVLFNTLWKRKLFGNE